MLLFFVVAEFLQQVRFHTLAANTYYLATALQTSVGGNAPYCTVKTGLVSDDHRGANVPFICMLSYKPIRSADQ